jgi:hypothetical protein
MPLRHYSIRNKKVSSSTNPGVNNRNAVRITWLVRRPKVVIISLYRAELDTFFGGETYS